MATSILNILHMSDLHYKATSSHDHDTVIEAFLADLKTISTGSLRPDLVMFSGDLVQDGDSAESDDGVFQKILIPILELTSLSEDRLLMAPGNHDVQRSALRRGVETQSNLEATLRDRSSLNEHYHDMRSIDFIRSKITNFLTLKECFAHPHMIYSDLYSNGHYIRELDLAVVVLNTTWMSRAGMDGHSDRGQLLVPEAVLVEALRKIPHTRARLVVGHHPLDWFAEFSGEDLRRIIEREGLIYLHGHMHDPIARTTYSTIGRSLTHQSGALFTNRDRYNGYALIRLAPEHGHAQIQLRSYYDKRNRFDVATNVVEDGCWLSSEAASTFWSGVRPPVDRGALSRWISERVASSLEASLNEGFTERPVSEVFVPPRLSKREARKTLSEDGSVDPADSIGLDEMLASPENFIVIGRPEFGKTTLLRQLALRLVRTSPDDALSLVPALIDFAEIKAGTNRLYRLLRAQLPDMDSCPFSFDDLLMQGHIVLLIDDFNFADARRRQEVANFVRTYPSVRLIITTRTELFSDLGVSASLDEAIPLRPIFMEQFRRRELRELVERWSLNPSVDRETLLDRLVHELVHINVPLTAVNGTILLSIYETQPDFTPINRAVLIETFVEKLFHKHQLNNARRDRFDFRNKAHLLSHIAKIMTLKDEYRMQYEDIVAESRCYFRTVGLVDRAREQVDRFLGARILAEKEGWISFRYRAFLEYFIARQMEEEALPGRWRKRRDFGTGSSGIHVTFLS